MPKEMSMSNEMSTPNGRGGHLYMQTNEVKNAVVHYHRSANGTLTEVERVATGGAGSGVFKPISGQDSAPNAFEGAGSVILSPDRQFPVCDERRRQFGLQLQLWAKTAGSLYWTPNRPATPWKEGAARQNHSPMMRRGACFTCCTHSAPTISG